MTGNKTVTANFTAGSHVNIFEAENLTVAASATGYSKVTGASGASNNAYVQFNAVSMIGDWIQFSLPSINAGTYSVTVYY